MTGSTRTSNPAESLFCDLIDELREHDDRVEEGTIMGGRCARVSGEFPGLVGYKGSGMVVKLPRDRVDEYLSLTFSVGSIIYGGGSWTRPGRSGGTPGTRCLARTGSSAESSAR